MYLVHLPRMIHFYYMKLSADVALLVVLVQLMKPGSLHHSDTVGCVGSLLLVETDCDNGSLPGVGTLTGYGSLRFLELSRATVRSITRVLSTRLAHSRILVLSKVVIRLSFLRLS